MSERLDEEQIGEWRLGGLMMCIQVAAQEDSDTLVHGEGNR